MAQNDLVAAAAPSPGRPGLIPIYVINLKRSGERRAWMQSELARSGVGAEFLAAADGRRFQARCAQTTGALSKEEVALVISHRMAWRKLLSGPASHAVVLEDDVHLGANFRDLLEFDFSLCSFDMIKLERWSSPVWISRQGVPVCGRKLHRLGYEHFGSAGYVIGRAAAGKVLAATKPIVEPVDVTLFGGRAMLRNELRVLQLVPAIAIQDCNRPEAAARQNLHSILHEDRTRAKIEARLRKPRGYLRIKRETLRVLRQIWRWTVLLPTMRNSAIPWE